MLSLVIESATDSLDLGALLSGPEGVQAIAGLTGAGLPPVSVQWSEGAGDGATYRGKRVLPRDIDIPLFVASATRAGLRATVKRLAMILADEATLRLTDSVSGEWTLQVVRTGGGDFIYGPDTDGENELMLVVTLRAGQPFWTSTTQDTTALTGGTAIDAGSITAYSGGSVPTPPVWEITGPGKNLTITAPNGERLEWNGTLSNGETLTIDSGRGTVTGGDGSNRYANLAPTPRFSLVPPMSNAAWAISMPNADAGLSRTNLCANPNAINNVTGYAVTVASQFAATTTIAKHPTEGVRISWTVYPGSAGADYGDIAVTAGETYSARGWFPGGTSLAYFETHILWYAGATFLSSNKTRIYPSDYTPSTMPNQAVVTAQAPAGATVGRVRLFAKPTNTAQTSFQFGRVMFEKSATAGLYFDGNTTDTATNVYAWTGTVGSSTSTLSLTPNRTTSQVRIRHYAREWLVI